MLSICNKFYYLFDNKFCELDLNTLVYFSCFDLNTSSNFPFLPEHLIYLYIKNLLGWFQIFKFLKIIKFFYNKYNVL